MSLLYIPSHLGFPLSFLSSFGKLLQPYEGDPGNYGLQVTDMDSLLNRTLESDKSGLQVETFSV